MAHPLLNEVGFDGPVGHPRARRGAGGGEIVGGADADARGQIDPAQSQGTLGRDVTPGHLKIPLVSSSEVGSI